MGQIKFGKGYHPEFDGYVWEQDKGIFISFIISKTPGRGNFLKYLDELKAKYEWIKIPTPSDRMMGLCLQKEFELKEELFPPPFDELGMVLIWTKKTQ